MKKTQKKKKETLGHGNHWQALGVETPEAFQSAITLPVAHGRVTGSFPAPWPNAPCQKVLCYELPQASLLFTALVGVFPKSKTLKCLSSFPVLTKTVEWIVQVNGPSDAYGKFEGVVNGEAASGHPLCWFAPRFGFEAADWQKPGPARVAFAALALELGRFAAEPIIIRDGPRIEERRAELRVEGRHAEADDPDLTVTFFTDMLRTFFSSFHDHHEFVGKIRRVRPICPRPEFTGWLLDLECLNNQPETGFIMPLYVFPDSLEEGYIPKRGDLVQGLAWLQGTWKEGSSSEITTIWQKEAEEPS